MLSAKGSTNFVHPNWAGFDIREGLARKLGKPVTYLNDGNAGALWGHFTIFGANSKETSVSIVIGTGLGGGIIIEGNVVKGRKGFGGELGHVLIPYQSIRGNSWDEAGVQLRAEGDLESVCSLTAIAKTFLPYFLQKYPGPRTGETGGLETCGKVGAWDGRQRRRHVPGNFSGASAWDGDFSG